MIEESEFLKSLEAAKQRLENPEPVAKTEPEEPKKEQKTAAPKREAKVEEKKENVIVSNTDKAEEIVINEPETVAASEEKPKVNPKAVSMIVGGCALVISVVLSLISVFFVSSDYIKAASFLVSIAAIIVGAIMMKKTGKGGLCLVLGIVSLVVTLVLAQLITALAFGIPA